MNPDKESRGEVTAIYLPHHLVTQLGVATRLKGFETCTELLDDYLDQYLIMVGAGGEVDEENLPTLPEPKGEVIEVRVPKSVKVKLLKTVDAPSHEAIVEFIEDFLNVFLAASDALRKIEEEEDEIDIMRYNT